MSIHSLSRVLLLIVAGWLAIPVAHGQVGQLFERVPLNNNPATPGGAAITTGALAITDEPIGEGVYDEDNVSGEIYAAAGSVAMSESGSALASAQVSGEASTLTPIGATTGIPEVEADLIVQLLGHYDDNTGFAGSVYAAFNGVEPDHNTADTGVGARSDFIIDGPEAQYLLHGTLHLAAAGLRVGFANLNVTDPNDPGPSLRASIGQWFVEAEWTTGNTWRITGELPGGITIDETTDSVNRYYNFSVPVVDESLIPFDSSISLTGGAYAVGVFEQPPSTLNYLLSAQAWAVATPLGESPVLGDVDGDGDVDIDDYIIVVQGTEEGSPNPTLGGGDTNQDRVVDATDLQNVVDALPGLPGDFDSDLDVEGADFLAWQRGVSTSANAQISDGDANFDEIVDGEDLEIWELGFGTVLSPSVTAVPEPTSMLQMVLVAIIIGMRRCKTSIGQADS